MRRDTSSAMGWAEGRRWDGDKVHGGDAVAAATQEGGPGLATGPAEARRRT